MSTTTFYQKYKILNKIGEGSFSEVLKCKDVRSGEYLAAKRLKKRFESVDEVFSCAEIIAMQKIARHPNILYMHEFHYDPYVGKVTYLFELMDMSLYDFMKIRKRCIPEMRGKNYLFQILSGLAHIHKNGLFHRDIKPENILIKIPLDQTPPMKCEIIKIADLGSIRGIYSRPPYTEYISTRWYRSPECLLTSGYYGAKMDIWASGCVFYEMLTLKPLFPGSDELDQLSRIHHVLGTPTSKILSKFESHKSCNCEEFPKEQGTGLSPLLTNVSRDGQDLMKLMLMYDPEIRSNVKRLLEHRYFMTFREHNGKALPRRVSTCDTTSKTMGDWQSTSIPSKNKPLKKNSNDKYVTTINRSRQNEVMDVKKFTIPGSLKRNINKMNNPKDQGKDYHKPPQQPLHREHHLIPVNSNYRKTTSNIPQLIHRSSYVSKPNPQSKSFILPRLIPKRPEIFTHIPQGHKDEYVLPKPQKIMVLDTTLRNITKNSAKRKKII